MKTLTVDSKNNCFQVDQGWMDAFQNTGASATLEPGMYVLRIKSGNFSYADSRGPEAFVLLWIYGGKFINYKTNVETTATWSSLNGFDDTLTLEVKETTNVCAALLDTNKDDNSGEVVVSILDA